MRNQLRKNVAARNLYRFLIWWITVAVLVLPLVEVAAHPHVFIVQRLTLVFDEKGFAGVKVRWKFDDMFASMIAEDHDANRNGKLEPKEVQSVKENAFAYIKTQNYFTFIKIDNAPFEVKFVTDFNAILEDKRLVYEFFIPCHVTAIDTNKKISVTTYDPSYYSAIYFAKKTPVSLNAAEAFDVNTAIREDAETSIYYDMVHPWALYLEFKLKT